MKKTGKRLENAKDKAVGEIKEATGKITGNEQLELKGKIQSSKADLKTKVYEVQDDITNTANRLIDKKKRK